MADVDDQRQTEAFSTGIMTQIAATSAVTASVTAVVCAKREADGAYRIAIRLSA